MPAHTINLQDPQDLLRIILTLVKNYGGIISFKCADYDTIDRAKLLVLDRDAERGEIIIRATSDFGSVAKVNPEAHQWTMPLSESPLARHRLAAEEDARRRSMPSDEDMAAMEEKLSQNLKVARDVNEGKSPTRITVKP